MRFFTTLLALVLLVRVAAADDRAAAIKKLVDAQAAALVAHDEAAFKKTLTSDGLVSFGRQPPVRDFVMQSGLMEPTKIAIVELKSGWTGAAGWVAVEAKFTVPTHPEMAPRAPSVEVRHWLALLVADGDGVKAKLVAVLPTMADKDLGRFDFIAGLPVTATPSALVAQLAQPVQLAKQLSSDPGTAAFGSSPTDRALGPDAAKKLLASWAKLKLELVDAAKPDDKTSYLQREVTAGDCTAAFGTVRWEVAPKQYTLFHAVAIFRGKELVALVYGPA